MDIYWQKYNIFKLDMEVITKAEEPLIEWFEAIFKCFLERKNEAEEF